MYNLRTNKQNPKTNKKVSSKNTKNTKNKNNNAQNSDMSRPTAIKDTTTPSRKSLREGLQNSLFNNVYNNNPESPFKLITVMDKRFDKLTEQIEKIIESKLNEYKKEFLNELNKSFQILKSEMQGLSERVTQIEAVVTEFKSMQEEIVTLKERIRHQENNNVACELRLNGIPFYEDENLSNIFSSICKTLKICPPAIKSIYRMQNLENKPGNFSPDGVIIVKMRSSYDRNFFLKTLSQFKKTNKNFYFCLRHVGIDSDNKFYINENLTRSNFQTFRAAARLKKKKILHSAFTLRGFVYIKRTINGSSLRVDDIKHLSELFPDIGGLELADHF